MITIKDSKFYRELKNLINCVRSYGIDHIDFKINPSYVFTDEQKDEFIEKVHAGFYLAQDTVIILLTKILKEQKKLKTDLKESRRSNDKELAKQIESKLKHIKYQEFVLRKVMDSMLWQFFQYDLSSLRRLYTGNTCIDITDSNLSSETEYIKQHRKNHPLDFVLINDLTSCAQIGDAIIVGNDKSLKIVELKEGKVNEQIFEIIAGYSKTQCPKYLYENLKNKDEKFIEQLKRDVKQIEKTTSSINTIVTGEGTDNVSGLPIKIHQEEIHLDSYASTVVSLLKECRKKGYGTAVINNCLLIGVYKTDKFSDKAFYYRADTSEESFPVFDLRQSVSIPLAFPLFLHPFSENDLTDIISGNIVVKMTMDIKNFFLLFEENGFTVKRLTKKETARINTPLKGPTRIFAIDGCGIEIKKAGASQYLCDGIFTRIFTEFNTPSSIVKNLLTVF